MYFFIYSIDIDNLFEGLNSNVYEQKKNTSKIDHSGESIPTVTYQTHAQSFSLKCIMSF